MFVPDDLVVDAANQRTGENQVWEGESRGKQGDKAIIKGNGKLTANNRPIVNSDSRERERWVVSEMKEDGRVERRRS